jgi:hypothetical protein
MQEIIIDISPTGDIKLEGNNIEGPDCKKLTEGIEEALGVVTASKKTPEYHRSRSVGITKRV